MTPREKLAAASRALAPFEQGDLDNLCGLYAIINAIKLALFRERRLSRAQTAHLFSTGVDDLQRHRQLRGALIDGLQPIVWERMARAITAEANQVLQTALHLAEVPRADLRSTWDAVRAIRAGIHHGAPAIVGLDGRLNHWSVIARYSRTRLTLFDSDQNHWIQAQALGVDDDRTIHRISSCGLFVLYPPSSGS